ncbi:hypothetical protein DFH09DRAFT_970353 [Mycena vulgaris]|nr:hypothetical protein DFH09DRAFT_970353 [Mycena vulgaris]
MPTFPLLSIHRRPNGKVLLLSLLACYSISGYYIVRSWPAPHADGLHGSEGLVTVTRTVRAPAATVTLFIDAPAPREEPAQPPLLNGRPTDAFQDNLRPEVKYITSWPSAGFTNDVITCMNLILLAISTQRIPIIPFFRPLHITDRRTHQGPNIDFSEVFDIPRLEKGAGTRILEWSQVKDRASESIDPLGCWNTREASLGDATEPYHSAMPELLKLDISYTTAPTWIKLRPHIVQEQFITFASLTALGYPETRKESLRPPRPSPLLKATLPPDEHLLCFDNLYYASSFKVHEIQSDFSPAWHLVGQHLHWVPFLEGLAQDYLRAALYLPRTAPVPPYIAVHVRHGDFAEWCGTVPIADCFAPLPVIARRVAEVRAALLASKGLPVAHVVMTSDEKDAAWWAAVRALGWTVPDHADTVRLYGKWYPVLIDAAIQSGAVGFVGTDQSTVSIIAGWRVKTWQGGEVRMFKWGKAGADDH